MKAVTPIPFTTPDGVQREVRWTAGARKRIHGRFGEENPIKLVNSFGEGIAAEVLYMCLYDLKGNPPADLTVEELAESLPGDGVIEAWAAILSALDQGQTSKNEWQARFEKMKQTALEQAQIGSDSGVSVLNASELLTPSSGTDSLSVKLEPELIGTANNSN